MPSNFPHIPFLSTLYLRLEFFFSLFFSCRPGRKWKKCLFFGAWAIWKQSLSLFLFFSSHSQCSHLLSQGNAVTGTFAQAVAIWLKRRKMERERQREEERRGSFGCNQSTILQTQKKKQRSWQLTADSAVRRLKAKWSTLSNSDRVRRAARTTTAVRNHYSHFIMAPLRLLVLSFHFTLFPDQYFILRCWTGSICQRQKIFLCLPLTCLILNLAVI